MFVLNLKNMKYLLEKVIFYVVYTWKKSCLQNLNFFSKVCAYLNTFFEFDIVVEFSELSTMSVNKSTDSKFSHLGQCR